MSHTPTIALIQPAHQPADLMVGVARAAEAAGIEEVWLWEDCFYASGIAPAAAILAATEHLGVGIGLLPVPLRAPTLTAMEIAAMARMFPGRFRPGLGHGILDWMGQAGVRVDSPLTLLREHLAAIGSLLRGEEVSTRGRYVTLDTVRLAYPPSVLPPLLVGGRGPRTLALGASHADGVILDDATPEGRPDVGRVRSVIEHLGEVRTRAGREGSTEIVAFVPTVTGAGPDRVAEVIGTLHEAGVHRVAVMAGGVDANPASGPEVDRFVGILADAKEQLGRGA